MPPIILTVDVEDYFQVSAFERRVHRDDWDSIPGRVESSTELLLQMFADAGVQGTFFVLGWVAAKYPRLVRRIADEGHELASHSYWHRLVYSLTPDEFRHDLRASRDAIGRASGVEVTAFRAPSFSITNRSLWALDVLVDEGFTVDSSIFPMRHDRYGIADARGDIHERVCPGGSIVEVPPSVWRRRRGAVPVGGGYFRLLPLRLTRQAIRGVQATGSPAMFYTHPWEFDPNQPRIKGIGPATRFRHYVGLRRTRQRMTALLREFPFAPMRDVLAREETIAITKTIAKKAPEASVGERSAPSSPRTVTDAGVPSAPARSPLATFTDER